jgi:hypothetical protein
VAAWLDGVIENTSGRVVDMEKLAKEHYFHPLMKGSTSIKYVLPAVLAAEGISENPYDALPPVELADGSVADAVREGTGAIRAYEEMVFGEGRSDPQRRAALKELLLQYCAMDTEAMVTIWRRWAETR